MHKNFYENELTGEIIEKMAKDVEQLIAKLKGGDDMTMELLSKSEIAREKNDRIFLCDACAKGWLSAIEATYTLLLERGVKEEELNRTDWGGDTWCTDMRGGNLNGYISRCGITCT